MGCWNEQYGLWVKDEPRILVGMKIRPEDEGLTCGDLLLFSGLGTESLELVLDASLDHAKLKLKGIDSGLELVFLSVQSKESEVTRVVEVESDLFLWILWVRHLDDLRAERRGT